jgi:pyruvate-formate lyase-activating enzyme
LWREADVPGRKPNVAERAGVTEDYILTSAKVVKGSAPRTSASAAKPGEAPIGTSGAQAMFDVKGFDEEKLKDNVGRRVQIEGTFGNVDSAQGDDLVELRGTVIRQVSGDCAKP